MKFLLIMNVNPAVLDALTEDERNAIGTGHGAFMDTITKSGELIITQALADPSQSAVVRVRGGQSVVTDGPYLEAKEYVGGFYLIDCESKGTRDRTGCLDSGREHRRTGRRGSADHVLCRST